MKNKKVQLVLILVGLLIFTVFFSLFSTYVRNSDYNNETTKKKKTTTVVTTTVDVIQTQTVLQEEVETPRDNKIENITPDLTKTVKDFSEIENKVYEVVNAFYPNTKKIVYRDFKQDKKKYSFSFDLKGDQDHEVIIYYWLKDESLSYQHY